MFRRGQGTGQTPDAKTFQGSTPLLQGQAIALRTLIEIFIAFKDRKGDSTVSTGDRQRQSSDSPTNDGHTRVSRIRGSGCRRFFQTRPL